MFVNSSIFEQMSKFMYRELPLCLELNGLRVIIGMYLV